jgi:hypothetical protein
VTPAAMKATIAVMRKRVDGIGAQSVIRRTGASRINVELPGSSSPTEPVIGKTAQLFFYDWEPNVIGPNGKPAPTEATVTGGANAGSSQFGLPEYQAVLRAAKRAPELRKSDTTWSKGCTPAQVAGCIYGTWYLLDAKHEKVIRGPEETKKNLYSDLKPKEVPNGVALKAIRVNPGTVLVQARPIESSSGKVTKKSPNSWFVVVDRPVLTGSERDVRIHRPRAERLSARDQGNRASRPGSAVAGRRARSRAAALRRRARRAADHGPGHRLHEVPRRHRRFQRLGDLGRLHCLVGARTRCCTGIRLASAPPSAGLAGTAVAPSPRVNNESEGNRQRADSYGLGRRACAADGRRWCFAGASLMEKRPAPTKKARLPAYSANPTASSASALVA